MHRGVLLSCWPWLLLLVGLVLGLRFLAALSGAKLQPRRLAALHRDQAGNVQSLSFVLTLPLFVMLMLLIVQVSQLMVAQVVVEYAAIAAARSAMVWIPAALPGNETENCISSIGLDSDQQNTGGGVRYSIAPGSAKYNKVTTAAVLACAPIAPSRSAGSSTSGSGAVDVVLGAYEALAPSSFQKNARVPQRIRNKLAYSSDHTFIRMTFVHKEVEPALIRWDIPGDREEFRANEVGWQDSVTVTVYHQLALLPGPGRLLFGRASSPDGRSDEVSRRIVQQNGNYTTLLSAAATIGNEGEKSVYPYVSSL